MSTSNKTTISQHNERLSALVDIIEDLPDFEEPTPVAQATPTIIIDTDGLITATATQTEGYVQAGTKSATKQLTTQGAKTITPSTLDQIAISQGVYATGNVTVQGDSNLIGANIVKGKSIFGVAGAAETGGGGGDTSIEDALINGNIAEYTNDRVKTIKNHAFYGCTKLTTVSFPVCTTIESYAFYACNGLMAISFPACITIYEQAFRACSRFTTINFPACISIYSSAFFSCTKLTTVSFPVCKRIYNDAFYSCVNLATVSLPACITIDSSAFRRCTRLLSLYLNASTVCTLTNSNAFTSTPIAGYTTSTNGVYGSIFVPASLVDAYKAATNWTYFAERITAILNEGDIITFTIDDVAYQAEYGMTFTEWCNSDYNTDGYYISTNRVCNASGISISQKTTSIVAGPVFEDTKIDSNGIYVTHS